MSRSIQWYILRLLLFIPVISLCGIIFLMASCGLDSSRPRVDCSGKASLQKHDIAQNDDRNQELKSTSVFLVILIMSGPKLLTGRQVLRETWLPARTSDILVKFVIGTAGVTSHEMHFLEKENIEHGDLLFLPDLHDSFKQLTQKLLEMYVWLDNNVEYSYVLKVDDDSLVRLDALMMELRQKNREKLYWGFFDGRARVHKTGKYAESNWVLCDRYIPYAKGGGYVLSADLVHFVSANAKYLKKYNGEDVSLGSWLAPIDVDRQHDTRFDTEYLSRGCLNSYLITHKQSTEEMRQKWQHYKRTKKLCVQEFQTRPSYIYDWTKPPTECCKRERGIP